MSSWRRFKKRRVGLLAAILLGCLTFIGVLAPYLSPYNPFYTRVGGILEGLSMEHPMGTDHLGRDVFSRVLSGTLTSLMVGFVAALTALVLGVIAGLIAGYYGGLFDDILMRVAEFMLVMPRLFLALVLVSLFGNSIWIIIVVIGILGWPTTARLIRAEVLSLKERGFVEATKAVGAGDLDIMVVEILPNAITPVIVNSSFEVAAAILTEAGLSFLGLGDANLISWGGMINDAQRYLRLGWWMAVFPGLAVVLTTFLLNILGDELQQALVPVLE